MFPRPAYRSICELDVTTRRGRRIDGRFIIREGWTLIGRITGGADEVRLDGPSRRAELDVEVALDLDVLQRVGPIEDGRPDTRLGCVGEVGCLILSGEFGLILTEEDERRDLEAQAEIRAYEAVAQASIALAMAAEHERLAANSTSASPIVRRPDSPALPDVLDDVTPENAHLYTGGLKDPDDVVGIYLYQGAYAHLSRRKARTWDGAVEVKPEDVDPNLGIWQTYPY